MCPAEAASGWRIEAARWPEDTAALRRLFRRYAAWLQVDLRFQDFEAELANLPGAYAPPDGGAWLLRDPAGTAQGCVALRAFDPGRCEMKRLWVEASARGGGWGRRLAETALAEARRRGYRTALLDTLPRLTAAIALYRDLGFRPVPLYAPSGPPETVAFACSLEAAGAAQVSETRGG